MNLVKTVLMAMILGNSIIYTGVWNAYGEHWPEYLEPIHTGFCLLVLWFAVTMVEWDLIEKVKNYQIGTKKETFREDERNEGIY